MEKLIDVQPYCFKGDLKNFLKGPDFPKFIVKLGKNKIEDEHILFDFFFKDTFRHKVLNEEGKRFPSYIEFERIFELQPFRDIHMPEIRQYNPPLEEVKYVVKKKPPPSKEKIFERDRKYE